MFKPTPHRNHAETNRYLRRWHRWFAWFPAYCPDTDDTHWLEWVQRRMVWTGNKCEWEFRKNGQL